MAVTEHFLSAHTRNVQIHLYKLEKAKKTFYLFGTNHSVSLTRFSKAALECIERILSQNTFFICEGFRDDLTQENLLKHGYFRDPHDKAPYWMDALNSEERNAVNTLIDSVKKRYQLTFDNREIQIGAIPLFIVGEIFDSGMDFEIQKKYRHENNFLPLQEESENFIPLSEREDTVHTVEDLKPILASHFFNLEEQALLKKNQAEYLTGKPVQIAEDDVDEMTENNKAWFNYINQMTRNKTSAMIIVGAAHLYGEYGLLTLYQKNGFALTRMNVAEGQDSALQKEANPQAITEHPKTTGPHYRRPGT